MVLPPLPEDRFLCGFSHIFAGGYSAGYYSYAWAEVRRSRGPGAPAAHWLTAVFCMFPYHTIPVPAACIWYVRKI